MTAGTEGIVTMYEDLGMPLEAIAEDQGLDITAVKLALIQGSQKYRNSLNTSIARNNHSNETFLPDDVEIAKQTLASLMSADNEGVRYRAAKFILNESKGRNDTIRGISQVNVNVFAINEQLKRARAAKKNGKEKIIDLKAADVRLLNDCSSK